MTFYVLGYNMEQCLGVHVAEYNLPASNSGILIQCNQMLRALVLLIPIRSLLVEVVAVVFLVASRRPISIVVCRAKSP